MQRSTKFVSSETFAWFLLKSFPKIVVTYKKCDQFYCEILIYVQQRICLLRKINGFHVFSSLSLSLILAKECRFFLQTFCKYFVCYPNTFFPLKLNSIIKKFSTFLGTSLNWLMKQLQPICVHLTLAFVAYLHLSTNKSWICSAHTLSCRHIL